MKRHRKIHIRYTYTKAAMTTSIARTDVEIPVIDIGELVRTGSDAAVEAAAAQMRAACRGSGFFYLSNHGIPRSVVTEALGANRSFHALPLEEKIKLKRNAWHRGYVPVGGNISKASARFAAARLPNQVASFNARHEVAPDHPDYKKKPLQGPNEWPQDTAFKAAFVRYNTAVAELGLKLLHPVSVALDERRDFFDRFFAPPSTNLRMMHYPPAPSMRPEDLFGIHPHTDYGFLTILTQDEVGGLQVRRPDGSWIDAPWIPDTFVVNVGDMLARWTNDHFNSTPHRVISPPVSVDRYSMALFFDPNIDAHISTLPQFVAPGESPKYEPINYGEYYARSLDTNFQRAGVPAQQAAS
jgi:isopenicillin N synthase-like dioxygenase